MCINFLVQEKWLLNLIKNKTHTKISKRQKTKSAQYATAKGPGGLKGSPHSIPIRTLPHAAGRALTWELPCTLFICGHCFMHDYVLDNCLVDYVCHILITNYLLIRSLQSSVILLWNSIRIPYRPKYQLNISKA